MAKITDKELGAMGACETADAIREGRLTAREAVDAAIARIEARNAPINAVIVKDFDRARARADELDASGLKGDTRPLIGVPMTVKESNDVEGLPTTWGFEAFADYRPKTDSVVVGRLKAAGAIILGKTNVPVALADWQSFNPVYGRTVNPHNHERSPGGSSGGSAAALASGMVALEIGSDIGGSIRAPAHLCGVFGHKPTYGIVSRRGAAIPGTDGVVPPLSCVGPLARHAKDLTVALETIAGLEPGEGYELKLPESRVASLKGARVLVMDSFLDVAADEDTCKAVSDLEAALRAEGAIVSRDAGVMPPLDEMRDVYVKMLNIITSRGTQRARPVPAHEWMDLQDKQLDMTRAMMRVFDQFDVLITPTLSVPAFPLQEVDDWNEREIVIDGTSVSYGSQVAWATIATLAGLPSTAVPVAKSREGLPIGLQVISAPYADKTTLDFAALLEEAGLATAMLAGV